jgi:cell division protein ZapE
MPDQPQNRESISVLGRYRALAARGTITPDAGQIAAAGRLDRLAAELAAFKPGLFSRRAPPRGIYLWGDVGRGKSLLMDLFFAAVTGSAKRRVHFNAFMTEAHGLLHQLRQSGRLGDPLPQAAKQLEQRLLCFDEFQVEDVADAMILGRLFEHLMARGCVIVATSNTMPDRLYSRGINRALFLPFITLIKARMEVQHLGGRDHRRAFDGEAFAFGPDAAAVMDAAWAALGGEAEHMGTLTVAGRALTVPRVTGKAARFGFAELCERPLGPGDYLAIAAGFSTLVIDAIPVFTPAMGDAARRFQTLIDILYDARVRLYCSAAAAPDGLFPQSDGFARTISRLLEMRSNAYISKACSGT